MAIPERIAGLFRGPNQFADAMPNVLARHAGGGVPHQSLGCFHAPGILCLCGRLGAQVSELKVHRADAGALPRCAEAAVQRRG